LLTLNGKGGSIGGTGYTVAEKGTIAFIELPDGETLVPQIASTQVGVGEVNPIIMLAGDDSKLFFNNDGFVLDGNAILYEIPTLDYFMLAESEGRKLAINTGELTIPSGVTLYIDVKETWPGIVGEPDAKIVLTAAQQLWLMDINNLDHLIMDSELCIFYQNGGTEKVTDYKLGNNTHTWKDDSDGNFDNGTTPGWVAGS
jgi:hypothetical protein